MASEEFSLESYETFLNRDEQAFYDWGIGILEDAGVVGVLKNKTVYLGNSLQGEIETSVGPAYVFALTKRSVEFSLGRCEAFPIGYEDVVLETGLNRIEASQVSYAFDSIRRNSAYLRAWTQSTAIATRGSTAFSNFRIASGAEIALEFETDSGNFTIRVRPTMKCGVYKYSVTDIRLQLQCSTRIADAVLSDAAEEVGAVPSPLSIVSGMVLSAEKVRSYPEWIASSASSGDRRGQTLPGKRSL